jgi:cyclic pyranopterin phosphate synthase
MGPGGRRRVHAGRPSPLRRGQRRATGYNHAMRDDGLSHLDEHGQARMVDVSGKPETERQAVARGQVAMAPATLEAIRLGDIKKGDVRAVARLAGIQAAKRTWELIPLCHPLQVTHVDVTGRTGVEMEALSAVAVACLTIYDMVKGVDRRARIGEIRLVSKRGGRSGDVQLE